MARIQETSATSYRAFLDYLRQNGELLDVHKEVDANLEAAAIVRKSTETRSEAPLFHNVAGAKNGLWRIAGAVGALGKTEETKYGRIAGHLGLPITSSIKDVVNKMLASKTALPIPPRVVASGPCKQNIIRGAEIDLDNLPVPMIHEKDGGKYLQTFGFHVVQTPDEKWTSWSMQRAMVYNKNHLVGLAVDKIEHNGSVREQWKAQGKDMPWALVLGGPPAATMVSSMPLPEGVSEGEYIGSVLGYPIDVVKCETSNLYVPATAEIVIEGVVSSTELANEGPYGEMHGYLYPSDIVPDMPLFRIDAITYRDNAILPITATGRAADETVRIPFHFQLEIIMLANIIITYQHTILGPVMSTEIIRRTQEAGLPIKEAFVPFEGHGVWAVLQVDGAKLREMNTTAKELSKKVADVVFQVKPGFFLHRIFLVGDDVDPFDFKEVTWAYATRCRPGMDEFLFDDFPGFFLIPFMLHGPGNGHVGGKMVSNCLLPVEYTTGRDWINMSFEEAYPEKIRERVLSEWNELGYTSQP
ncbi:hypothetical protein B7463_g2644, partial [Scytalidium lignicola]